MVSAVQLPPASCARPLHPPRPLRSETPSRLSTRFIPTEVRPCTVQSAGYKGVVKHQVHTHSKNLGLPRAHCPAGCQLLKCTPWAMQGGVHAPFVQGQPLTLSGAPHNWLGQPYLACSSAISPWERFTAVRVAFPFPTMVRLSQGPLLTDRGARLFSCGEATSTTSPFTLLCVGPRVEQLVGWLGSDCLGGSHLYARTPQMERMVQPAVCEGSGMAQKTGRASCPAPCGSHHAAHRTSLPAGTGPPHQPAPRSTGSARASLQFETIAERLGRSAMQWDTV